MSEQGIQRKGRTQSKLTGFTPEVPPRLSNKDRTEMRKNANAALKRSQARMAAKVKFTPANTNQGAPYYSAASAGLGTPVNIG